MIDAVLAGFFVFAGTTTDRLGDSFGGVSSVRWDERRGELVALSDRGPGDGTVPYAPRIHRLEVREREGGFSLDLRQSIPFRDAKGELFSGLIVTTSSRLDPEGLVVASDGGAYVSEEYEPTVYRFAADGRLLKKAAAPAAFQGRVDNRGLEGLCRAPSGKLLALLQSPLKQDGGKAGKTTKALVLEPSLSSASLRVLDVAMPDAEKISVSPALKQEELAYNECEALSEDSFLLLERDNRGLGEGTVASYKRIARLDLLPDGTTRRSEWLDLLPVLAAGGVPPERLPAKFESLAWGRRTPAGRELWVAVDNDFKPGVPTFFFRLVVR